MQLVPKITSVASNPAMLSAYARWLGAKWFLGKPPRLSLSGADAASIGEWLSFSEYWSFQDIVPDCERLFVERCLADKSSKDKVAIDCGANVGVFTCLLGSMGCTVHAFEPIPETFCRLKSNVRFNDILGRTHLNCLAVGKEQGLVQFQVQEDAPATNRMAPPKKRSAGNLASIQSVAAVCLDGYCAERGIENIALLKIDVEGMEPLVLQGASSLLSQRKVSAVLIEICPVNLHSVGLSPADLFREFESVDYFPHLLNEDGTPGVQLTLGDIEAMSLANIVLLPNS